MNAESSRLRSTGTIDNDISAIWTDVVLIVYLGVTELVLLAGHARASMTGLVLHTLVLATFVAAAWLPTVPRWLRRWAPLIALLFLYAELPMLASAAGRLRLYDGAVLRWEQALFGAQPSLTWATAAPSRILGEVLHAGYLSYYAIIFVVPGILYLSRRLADFDEAVFVLMATFVTCFVWYIVFPVAGPRYVFASRVSGDGFFRHIVTAVLEARSSRGTAFPSSHVAVATAQSILAVRYFRGRGVAVACATVLLACGAVYGGFHYAVDVLAGAVTGLVVTALALIACRALRKRDRTDVLHVVAIRR